jgi:PPOX class probable F420-dependent enzyme
MDELSKAKYIAFGTYRKDGSLKSTPTWVVPYRQGYAFTTELGSWKTKRLVRDHRVVVTASDFRGRALTGASTFEGRGEILEDASALEVERAIRAKYRVMYLLTITPRQIMRKALRRPKLADCAVYFVIA